MNSKNVKPHAVIAAHDFSPLADRALEEAIAQCAGRAHAQLHTIVVAWQEPAGLRMPGPEGRLLSQEDAERAVRERVEKVIGTLLQRGVDVQLERVAVYVASGEPGERICALSAHIDADLIVLGTHGRVGLARWVLGSVAEEVVRRASCGVLVVRPRDFLQGEQLPAVEAPLAPGQHSLKPFHHSATYHYVQRGDRSTGRVLPVG